MAFGVTLSAVIRSTCPKGAVFALSASSPLSNLLESQCILSKSKDTSSRSISRAVSGGCHRPPKIFAGLVICPHQEKNHNALRCLSSKTGEDGSTATGSGNSEDLPSSISGSSQHDTWVQFQRNIAVSGFDTGQTVSELKLNKKNRGGVLARKRKEREEEALAALKGVENIQLKGGEFQELRYSDEETERLLAEAYAAIPPRAGKRGTLNLKRQKRRWWIKRQYDYKKKCERTAAHKRKLEKKKRIRGEIKQTRVGAADIRKKDTEYHNLVLQRWAGMNGHNKKLQELEEPRRMELVTSGWKI